MHTDLGDGQVLIDGQFVSAKVERVVLAIKEYSEELDVKWVPPQARVSNQAAFKIIHNGPNGEYVLFHVPTEEEFDERVLVRIMVNDQRSGAVKYTELEAWEEAQKRVAHQEWLDKMEEAMDIAEHLIKTPLNDYKVSKDLRVIDGIPHNAAHLDHRGLPKRGSEGEGRLFL